MDDQPRSLARRAGTVAAGTIVTGVGVALLVLPGPGLITMAVGLNMIGKEIPAARRVLDRARRTLRSDGRN
ncbi:MAG TPA: PGPGW domain-containing protein [Acidimicrobiia bacterium]|nr:PGPGW domain-containing protein [Acidimicrobiia bacterium]